MVQPTTPATQGSAWTGSLGSATPGYRPAWPIAPDPDHVVYTDAFGDYYRLAELTDTSVTEVDVEYAVPALGPRVDYFHSNVFSNDQGFAWWTYGTGAGNATNVITFTPDATTLTYTTARLGTAVSYNNILASHASDGYVADVFPRIYWGFDLDGTQRWNWVDAGTATATLVYAPTPDLFVRHVPGSAIVELRDDTGAQLSTASIDAVGGTENQYWAACTPRHVCRLVFNYTTKNWRYRVLDTTGDTLSWVDTEQTITTGWATADTYEPTSWQGQIAIPPVGEGDAIYWLNPFTHQTASTVTAATGRTIAAGWYRTFASGRSTFSQLFAYVAPTPPAPRRAIGGNPRLRQRQTPFYTR